MAASYHYSDQQSARDAGSDSAYDPYKVAVHHGYKQTHGTPLWIMTAYGFWQYGKYSSLFMQCNCLCMGGSLTRTQWGFWDVIHFQFLWAKILPQTFQWDHSLKQSQGLILWRVSIIRDGQNVAYLHARAYCKRQLTQRGFQNVDQRHGDENLLRVQDVPLIERYVDSKHGEGNLGEDNPSNVSHAG